MYDVQPNACTGFRGDVKANDIGFWSKWVKLNQLSIGKQSSQVNNVHDVSNEC